MAMSIQDVRLAVKNARRCESRTRLLVPTSNGNYACTCMNSRLVPANQILNELGQKVALIAEGEVSKDAFGETARHYAYIASLPTVEARRDGLYVEGRRVVKKRKWSRKEVIAANEVVAVVDGGVMTASVYEVQ